MEPNPQEMTDLEVLRLLEAGACAAIISWAAAASDAHDDRLRRFSSEMVTETAAFQGQVRKLILQLGGAI